MWKLGHLPSSTPSFRFAKGIFARPVVAQIRAQIEANPRLPNPSGFRLSPE